MNDYKIKYRLEELQGDGECWPFLFQVLEQDSCLDGKDYVIITEEESGIRRFSCSSYREPSLNFSHVGIRGSNIGNNFGCGFGIYRYEQDRASTIYLAKKAIEKYVNTHCQAEKLEAVEIEPHVYQIGDWITYRLQVIEYAGEAFILFCVYHISDCLSSVDFLKIPIDFMRVDNNKSFTCLTKKGKTSDIINGAKKAHAAILEYVRVNTQQEQRKTVEVEKGIYCV